MENKLLAAAEAVLFAAAEAVEYTKLGDVLGLDGEQTLLVLDALIAKLNEEESGICLLKLGTKYQLCSKKEYIEPIRTLLDLRRNAPLSQAAFEVLAIVAYNQPITKAYIEQIRGVDCSGVLTTLVARELIEEKGRLDVPGRPILYGTTSNFLRCFSLESLADLPEVPTEDRDVLMADVDDGQMSMFDGGADGTEPPVEAKEDDAEE